MRIIGGKFKGHSLLAPKGDATRPTASQLREAVFNICQDVEGATFLDLFSGSGAIGLEALSRGAKSATFVDHHPFAIKALQENLKKLQLESEIFKVDVMKALENLKTHGKSFDVIFVDPPYEAEPKKKAPKGSLAAKILQFIDNSSLLSPQGLLFIEEGGRFEKEAELVNLKEGKERTFGKSYLFSFHH